MLVTGHPVKVTCVHPGGIKTAVARNATVCDGEDAQAFAEFFDKYLALHSPEMATANDRRRCLRWPCAGGVRLGGQSPRRAVAAHGVGVSEGHGHRGSAVLPVGQQALTVSRGRRAPGMRRCSRMKVCRDRRGSRLRPSPRPGAFLVKPGGVDQRVEPGPGCRCGRRRA